MQRAEIEALANAEGLTISGVVQSTIEKPLPNGAASLILLSPKEPLFWSHVQQSPEAGDGTPDPLDRWSLRVISELALRLGGEPFFPFGGPPYHPFYTWAIDGGEVHVSPVALLTSQRAGLFASFRGAIALSEQIATEYIPSPCVGCAKPCTTSCPVGAMGPNGYDVPKCHAFLDSSEGQDCLSNGCRARRACPAGTNRLSEQSAHHMSYFHR